MLITLESEKLSMEQDEYALCSGPYVFFRVIVDKLGARLMTATASENSGRYREYEDQKSLLETTAQVLAGSRKRFLLKYDHAQRPYVETSISLALAEQDGVASAVLKRLGIGDYEVRTLHELYDDFAIGEDHGATYLSDGIWVTADGRLIEN